MAEFLGQTPPPDVSGRADSPISQMPKTTIKKRIDELIKIVSSKNSEQHEFLQAFEEMAQSLGPVIEREPKYLDVLEFLAEPERVIIFRVPWVDDTGKHRLNRAFRVQFSSVLGPYKGGLRFHPSVNLSVMKFLGFEQIFKNALTGLPMGGGKGGTDFNPQGKSEAEILRFCQSFMTELYRHIGPNTDVPAGDIGVGARELGYLFGQYRRIVGRFEGSLTGKGAVWGGSRIRPEATGYGCVYFAKEALADIGKSLNGMRCIVSGSGNVAQYCAEKLLHEGAVVLTFSDSSGYVYEESGFTMEQVKEVMRIKNVDRGRISEYAKISKTAKFVANMEPWEIVSDAIFPCATQNELDIEGAAFQAKNGCKICVEGANMPTTNQAIRLLKQSNVIFCPAKAANAGGVAVSGLEMSQNSLRMYWTREEVDEKLRGIMKNIYHVSKEQSNLYGHPEDLQMGVNIAGFKRLAEALMQQGWL